MPNAAYQYSNTFDDTLAAHFKGILSLGFDPRQLQELLLWLDAADVSTILKDGNNKISKWLDRSGKGFEATQVTESSQPLFVAGALNNKSCIRFSGTQLLNLLNFSTPQNGQTIFLVVRLNNAISTMNLFPRIFRTTNDSQSLFIRKATGQYEIKSIVSGASDPRPVFSYETKYPVTTPALITNTIGSSSLQIYSNGELAANIARSATATAFSGDTSYQIGESYTGDIFDILVFSGILSAENRQKVGLFLANKWALPFTT